MAVVTTAASIFVKVFRISGITEEGNVAPGAITVATKDGTKLSVTPVIETGDDIVVKNASGDIAASAKHGDMIKYYTAAIELAKPDPQLEALCCGGVMLGSSAAALGEPSGLEAKPLEKLGILAKGFYGYRATQYNAFGESKAEPEVLAAEAKNATPENAVIVGGIVFATGAIGARIYGRVAGVPQLIGTIPNIAKPKLKTAIAAKGAKAKTPMTIEVETVTKGIPANTIIRVGASLVPFKVLGFVEVGATTMTVEPLEENAAEVKAEEIKPILLDTGEVTPAGSPPESDTSAGPGENIGYQAPALGPVANTAGVSIEAWGYAYVEGAPAAAQPYWWWVLPRVRYMHIQPRDLTNANTPTIMEGQAIGNPHWGAGPFGEWPVDSSKAVQRIRCGPQVVPAASYEPLKATV